jgi:hypothetical protein
MPAAESTILTRLISRQWWQMPLALSTLAQLGQVLLAQMSDRNASPTWNCLRGDHDVRHWNELVDARNRRAGKELVRLAVRCEADGHHQLLEDLRTG